MTVSTVSSAYLSSAFLPAVQSAQKQLSTLEVESSTGQYADLGLQLGSQNGYELSLRNDDDLLQSLKTANGITSTNLTTSQNALASLLTTADDAATSIVTWSSAATTQFNLQTLGDSNLSNLTALANTSTNSGYVLAGINSGVAPLNDYSASGSSAKAAIEQSFQSYFGFSTTSSNVANITSTQMQSYLTGPFADQFSGVNWTSNWSTASDDNTTAQIAPGTVVTTSGNTNDAAFKQLAQGYTMLSAFGDIGLSAAAEQTLASTASSAVSQGISSLTSLKSTLGQAQSRIAQADDDMTNQMTLLQTQINSTDNVDSAKVATQLSTLSTQLETAYELTSQIHNMNLAQYISG